MKIARVVSYSELERLLQRAADARFDFDYDGGTAVHSASGASLRRAGKPVEASPR